MNIVKWTPYRELEDMQTRLNRFFGDAPLRTFEANPPFFADWAPPVDVEETDKEYLIKAELPDMPKENVKVEMLDGVLTIEGRAQTRKGGERQEVPQGGTVLREVRPPVRAAGGSRGGEHRRRSSRTAC